MVHFFATNTRQISLDTETVRELIVIYGRVGWSHLPRSQYVRALFTTFECDFVRRSFINFNDCQFTMSVCVLMLLNLHRHDEKQREKASLLSQQTKSSSLRATGF